MAWALNGLGALLTVMIRKFWIVAGSEVVKKLMFFVGINIVLGLLMSLFWGNGFGIMTPTAIIGEVSNHFASIGHPGILWAIDYWMIPQGLTWMFTALIANWGVNTFLKAGAAAK